MAGKQEPTTSLRATAWVLRLLLIAFIAVLCVIAHSFGPAIAFAINVVPCVLFVTAHLTGHLRFPGIMNAVHPMEPVLYRWLGVGIAKRLVATRLWPIFVGVVPPPTPSERRDLLVYTESSTKGAEICHLVTFVLATIVAFVLLAGGRGTLAVWTLAFNMLLNGYPIMLQRSTRCRVHQIRQRRT